MTRPTLIGFVLVDIPFLFVVAVLGVLYGFRDVATGYLDWREANQWSWLASLAAVGGFVVWRRRRA